MMWIFEWDILTGDSAVLDVIYAISRDELDEAIAGGDAARSRPSSDARRRSRRRMPRPGTTPRCATRSSAPSTTRRAPAPCSAYRAMILRQAQWHDTASPAAYDAWRARAARVRGSAAAHEATYAGDVDYPAYNLTAAELGVRARRPRPGDGLGRAHRCSAARGLARASACSPARTRLVRRPAPPPRARSGSPPPDRGAPASHRSGSAARPGAHRRRARAAARREPRRPDLVPRAGAPARRARRLARLRARRAARWRSRRRSPWPVHRRRRRGGRCCASPCCSPCSRPPGPAATGSRSGPTRSRRSSTSTSRSPLFVWVFVAAGWALATPDRPPPRDRRR